MNVPHMPFGKQLLSLLILSSISTSLSVFSLKMIWVSAAPASPYIAVVPQKTMDPTLTLGKNYTVSIYTDYTGVDIQSYQFTLSYNPNVLQGVEVINGDLITKEKQSSAQFIVGKFNNTEGTLSLTAAFFFFIFEPAPITSGPGTLAIVTFTVVGKGTSSLTLGNETKLIGYTESGMGDPYNIIDAATMPNQMQNGSFDNTIHDVAVINVIPSPTSVKIGERVSINVTVTNEGESSEAFNVTVYYDDTIVATNTSCWTTPLRSKNETTLIFDWNTTGIRSGIYNITASASILPGETNTLNNVGRSQIVIVGPPIAIITYSPREPIVDETVTFDASASYDPDAGGEIVSYAWNFGDGTILIYVKDENLTAKATHVYTTPRTYKVTLTVTDIENKTDTDAVDIQVLVHDIAITNVEVSPNTVTIGETVSVNVTVVNEGNFSETFSVTIYYNTTVIETKSVTNLASDDSKTLAITWNTTNVAEGKYTIKAVASKVEGEKETYTNDNTYIDGTVTVTGEEKRLLEQIVIYATAAVIIIIIVGMAIYFLKIRKPKPTSQLKTSIFSSIFFSKEDLKDPLEIKK